MSRVYQTFKVTARLVNKKAHPALAARVEVSSPPEVSASVVEPQYVKLTVWIVGNNDGTYYRPTTSCAENMRPSTGTMAMAAGITARTLPR